MLQELRLSGPRCRPALRGGHRRYDAQKPLLLSTNKAFKEWGEVFPHAACVVTLVDRLLHRAEVIEIDAESYRLQEAKELNAARVKQRRSKKH